MNEMIRALKFNVTVSGELYLNKDKTENLIRWLELCARSFNDYEAAISELKKLRIMSEEIRNEISNIRSTT